MSKQVGDSNSGGFNLSEWALNNRGLVLYAMIALAIIGA